jgi:hypothetical protein
LSDLAFNLTFATLVGVVPEENVVVVSDRIEASPGSETGRDSLAVKQETARCTGLIDRKLRSIYHALKNFPLEHVDHKRMAAAESLRSVKKWIESGRTP